MCHAWQRIGGSFGFVRCAQQEAANLPLTIDAFGFESRRLLTEHVRRLPGQAAAILDVADGTVRGKAAREGKIRHLSFAYPLRRRAQSVSDLTYSDLSWNARRSARMFLPAKGTCLPHFVAMGFADGIAIAVI
jgi:hypothetical protein